MEGRAATGFIASHYHQRRVVHSRQPQGTGAGTRAASPRYRGRHAGGKPTTAGGPRGAGAKKPPTAIPRGTCAAPCRAHVDWVVASQLHKVPNLIIIHSPHDHHVDLDCGRVGLHRGQAGGQSAGGRPWEQASPGALLGAPTQGSYLWGHVCWDHGHCACLLNCVSGVKSSPRYSCSPGSNPRAAERGQVEPQVLMLTWVEPQGGCMVDGGQHSVVSPAPSHLHKPVGPQRVEADVEVGQACGAGAAPQSSRLEPAGGGGDPPPRPLALLAAPNGAPRAAPARGRRPSTPHSTAPCPRAVHRAPHRTLHLRS